MSLEELAASQKQTGDEIQRLLVNYKKDSPSRKTLQYLQDKLQKVDSLWEKFDGEDYNIRLEYESNTDHPYFTKGYYEAVRNGYEEMRQDIIARMESHKENLTSSNVVNKTQQSTSDGGAGPSNNQGKDPKADASRLLPLTNNIQGLIRRQQAVMDALWRTLLGLPKDNQPQSQQFYTVKIRTIERYWSDIEELNSKIWEQTNDPGSEGYVIENYLKLEEETQNKLIQLHEGLGTCVSPTAPVMTPAMKLPKIELPKFDGDYLKWRQFHDIFTEVVHNQSMADCQKLWYLKSSLTGEAERLVRHLTISDANYGVAWKIVKERYENTRLLVTAFLNKLLTQPTHTSESAASIKSLHDTTQECLLGLNSLGIQTDLWDPLLLHILLKKLDRVTHGLYEQSLVQPRKLQPLKGFLSFLETRFQSLEAFGSKGKSLEDPARKSYPAKSLSSVATPAIVCTFCKGNHKIYACSKFLQLTPAKRLNFVKRSNLCVNCLRDGHNSNNCPSGKCTKCSRKHNTLLHLELPPQGQATPLKVKPPQQLINNSTTSSDVNQPNQQVISLMTKTAQAPRGYVLLSTIMVTLTGSRGTSFDCRAILDSGSQLNFITERVVKRLQLTETPDLMCIEGIGERKQQTQLRVNVLLKSRTSGFSTRLEAHVLPRIISPQPIQAINTASWPIPNNITLADPEFNKPDCIDLLIGAELYFSILSIGQIKLGKTLPTLQNTVFGWTVAGKIDEVPRAQVTCGVCSEDDLLDQKLERFWKIEEAEEQVNQLTAAEKRCEIFFNQTTKRSVDGRFIVRLPFINDANKLGESKDIALQRFTSLERKLSKHEGLRHQYIEFMAEYRRLGHMKEANFNSIQGPYYFLPHHSVIKPDSTTTKLRVVFDASAKTSSNLSLNDVLATGPTIQDDVFSILLRFRLPRFVFTADIEKMYRQIQVDEADQKYQLIWWRDDPKKNIQCFQLSTVTYGTTSAPYLATKCLEKLAEDHATEYPLGSEILKRDFYMDDVMTGSDSLTTALIIQQELQSLLQRGGFRLRKWCANHPRLLRDIPDNDKEVQLDFSHNTEEPVKTVGLTWLPKTDSFCIRTSWTERERVTKRIAYSEIAHLFDPLGIMAPVVIVAKMFLQRLWTLKLDWDAALPQELHTTWVRFREGLKVIKDIKFPRHVFSNNVPKSVQIHVFADASEKAYGAAVYTRAVNKDNTIAVRLLCAKSRVAPIKQTTLPRLELSAAKLAADLAHRVKKDLNLKNPVVYFWSDSQIVLSWINSSSSSFQTFVANRVSAIQDLTIPEQWRHVNSKENPADVLSRGLSPEKLGSCNLWFYGPPFLHGEETLWPPVYKEKIETDLEKRRVTLASTIEVSANFIQTINHGNSFRKLQRIVAYVLRFVHRTKGHRTPSTVPNSVFLTSQDLEEAHVVIIKFMQEKEFKEDITNLKRFNEISKNSDLTNLAPFLDERGILRVGGRVENSDLSFDAKHQILLPYSHPFTKLLISDLHKENFHAGPQATLAISRQRYWAIKGKVLARSVVQHCVRCARAKPKLFTQIMGNLPAHRVQPARPFVNSGVDFCGPIWTHYKIRGKRPQKSYIAVFCCFATKATHLEVVTDLSTQGFIGALKRFMGRRGHCKNIYCDNATNFVGAKNQLQEIKEIIESNKSTEKIIELCNSKGTDFHLIPPRAPHFGGLWEAAVKSAKHLLQRTIGSASLTYEELETAVIEIEAILNSRPLTPMSSDPNDLTALTPGHFLIGEPLTSSIDPQSRPLQANVITRWRLITHVKNEFWRRWSNEYLNHLQHRYRWKHRCHNVQPGIMVIIKEDNIPPLKWHLGRIIKTFKGDDGLVRVVEVRTANGVLRRAIHQLAPLPVDDELNSNNHEGPNDNDRETQHLQRPTAQDPKDEEYQPQPSCSYQIPNAQNLIRTATPDSDETPKKRTRLSIGSAVLSLLLTCLIIPITKGSPVEVTPLTSQPGIHFENLGVVNIFSSEWHLVAYYDMQPFGREFEAFKGCIRTLKPVCHSMNHRVACLKIVDQLQFLSEEISKITDLLKPNIKASRSRRGAIDFVGNIANALFGVLDSEYAEEMSNTIDNIKNNENHILNLVRNQTSIIDATVNVMQQDQEAVHKHFLELEDHIDQINRQLHQQLHQDKIAQEFTFLSMQAMLIASNLQRVQASILDVIIDTHHGKLSPQLISPAQLKSELMTIKGHLPLSLRLPAEPSEVLRLYNLMTIEGRATEKHIIFRLKLPLLSLEDFELFRVIPVPTLINNTFVAIRPSFPLLVINLHRDQYYPLTEQELHLCTAIMEGRYLCKQEHPIYRKGSVVSSCEVDLLNNLPQSHSCKVMKTEDGPHWIQLFNPNQWIYVLKAETTINVVCGHNVTQMVIHGSGILKIQNNCIIKQPLITIQGHNVYPSISRLSYTPSTNLTSFVKPEQLTPVLRHTSHYQPHLEELENLKERILQLNKEKSTVVQPQDVHHYTIGYTGLFLTIATIAYLVLAFLRKKTPPRPIPTPRRLFEQQGETHEINQQADFNFNV